MSNNKSQFAELEEEVFDFWEKNQIFQKSLDQRKGKPIFSFYDGPPFANGLPHYGHILASSIKDSMLRYKTMQGYYVPRRNGWDCHGLPVEYAVEKDFGVSGKKQILDLGLDKFNTACRESIFKYKDLFEKQLKRLGRWSEYDKYYATVDANYTESVWWALSEIHKKGLLYKGYKSTPYCPRCETPLSNFEVNEGYKDDISDPSLYVKFELTDEEAYLLAWTTTPWSLPGNAAIAVNPKEAYVYVHLTSNGIEETIILAKKRLSVLDEQDYRVVKEVLGTDLVGKSYKPLFKSSETTKNLYSVLAANFVSVEDGTGVLHVAPAFGEDDLNLGEEYSLPVLSTVDPSGHMVNIADLPEVEGKFFKSADKIIIEHLTKNNLVFAAETFTHTYPFCWRCETPLLYYAINSWFIKVSDIRSNLVNTAKEINWTPANIKSGRFGKWLEGAKDWAISRNRYWGAPMPIWVNEKDSNDYIVVDSFEKLKELVGDKSLDLKDVHRPFIDNVVININGKTYKRVEEVIDCWFESGCMSIGQQHYPFENKEEFTKTFPADFIIEGLDQTRLWFYVQHVVNTILFEKPAYKNVIVNGIIMAADGQKLSKRLKNYPPLEDVFENEGADSLRLFLLSSTQATQTADYLRFNRDALKDLNRNVLGTLMNTLRFFTMYTKIDNWKPPKKLQEPKSDNVLDQWLLSRLAQTVEQSTKQADDYKIAHAIGPVFELIDDLSNWYVRRSRRRFWKSEDDDDKNSAYLTLHYSLLTISQLIAPWAPFVSEKIYQDLTEGMDTPQSVHLSDWPVPGKVNQALLGDMMSARDFINEGLRQRAGAGIKVRQPLHQVTIPEVNEALVDIIGDELNVKMVNRESKSKSVVVDTMLTDELKIEGLMRDLIRIVQNARKSAGLNVEDRIHLLVDSTDKDIQAAIDIHGSEIKNETLAHTLNEHSDYAYSEKVKINSQEVHIGISKVRA